MFKTHKTKDGRKLQICEMEDSHLERTIRMLLKNLCGLNDVLDGKSNFTGSASLMAMRGVRKASLSFDQVAELQSDVISKLYPYLAEAYLRNFTHLIEDVRNAFQRNGMLSEQKPFLAIGELPDGGDIADEFEF